jgi:hypothetical protein
MSLKAAYSIQVWRNSACCETEVVGSMLAATSQEEEDSAVALSEILAD